MAETVQATATPSKKELRALRRAVENGYTIEPSLLIQLAAAKERKECVTIPPPLEYIPRLVTRFDQQSRISFHSGGYRKAGKNDDGLEEW